MEIVKSVSYTNFDTITEIMKLYNIERFDLDCTYSKGAFWKDLPEPINKSDLSPQVEGVIQANSENLPFEDNSMKTIMYDPPFVIAGNSYKDNVKGSSIIAKRFEGYVNFKGLRSNYFNTMKELYRVCEKDGLVVFKCQDTVSGGKNHFTHNMVMQMALHVGFQPKDLFILLAKNRLNSFGTKWKKQEHARKYHSYFWVFKKTSNRVDYDFTND